MAGAVPPARQRVVLQPGICGRGVRSEPRRRRRLRRYLPPRHHRFGRISHTGKVPRARQAGRPGKQTGTKRVRRRFSTGLRNGNIWPILASRRKVHAFASEPNAKMHVLGHVGAYPCIPGGLRTPRSGCMTQIMGTCRAQWAVIQKVKLWAHVEPSGRASTRLMRLGSGGSGPGPVNGSGPRALEIH